MKELESIKLPESAGVFEDLSPLEFMILEKEGVSYFYFRDKSTKEYGVPVPDPSVSENYYKKYLETILFDIFEELEPSFLFDGNNFIKIDTSKEIVESIRRKLILSKATEEKIISSILKFKILDDYSVQVIDDGSMFKEFKHDVRFKEIKFRMMCAGFFHKEQDIFIYENQAIESIKDALNSRV